MAQQCTLDPSDRPEAQLVTSRHAADFATPDALVKLVCRHQVAFGVILQLDARKGVVVPNQNITLYSVLISC